MKPYQDAYEVAMWQKYHKRKPINIDAITEYYKAGLKREIDRITDSSIRSIEVLDDMTEWNRQLTKWLYSWYTWIHS